MLGRLAGLSFPDLHFCNWRFPMAIWLSVAAVIGAIVLVNLHVRRFDHEWHRDPSHLDKMRRRINGKWQYRDMTDAELTDHLMDW
jgi:hypothetical protein